MTAAVTDPVVERAAGRWTGKYWEWSCPTCSHVMQAPQPPAPEEARCHGCKVLEVVSDTERIIRALIRARDGQQARRMLAEREVERLTRELAAANEAVVELRAMVERAQTEPVPARDKRT